MKNTFFAALVLASCSAIISCDFSEPNKQLSDSSIIRKGDTCDDVSELMSVLYSSGSMDSLLGLVERGGLFPELIRVQANCESSFDSISTYVLLRFHREALDDLGFGRVLSRSFNKHPSIVLFLSNYMKSSQNYSSSSNTEEIYNWYLEHYESLSEGNKKIISDI